MDELIIATHNQGKKREIESLLQGYVQTIYSAADLDLPEPVEDGDSFVANAKIKAIAAAKRAGKPALADDSGLSVMALDGAPGIYSARWGGEEKDFNKAMARVHQELGDAQDRSAHFVCVLALAFPDGRCEVFEGFARGRVVWPPRGEQGFGYDPMFCLDGMDQTFAEIDPAEKERLSHRAQAFEKFVNSVFKKAA